MNHWNVGFVFAGVAVVAGAMAACSSDDASDAPVLAACPTSPPPEGGAAPGAGAGGFVMAKTIVPSDTSTSIVIDANASPQIQCGRAALSTYAGVAFAAPAQYRTILDGATYVEGVADVKSAVRFLRAHADQYGIDPSKVGVWGESAGGYLASMVGTTKGATTFDVGDNLAHPREKSA